MLERMNRALAQIENALDGYGDAAANEDPQALVAWIASVEKRVRVMRAYVDFYVLEDELEDLKAELDACDTPTED